MVRGVTTKQGRDITAVVNESSRPLSFLGMLFGENSSLDENSRRDQGGCDVSGNLPHISICRAVEAILVPPNDKPAFWRWTARTEQVLDTAREWYVTNIAWAEQPLGAADPQVDLLAACLWNAPNAGAVPEAKQYGSADPRTRTAAADFWLDPDLASRGPEGVKYAARRQNYIRGLAQAERYRVKEEPPMADTYVIGQGVRDLIAERGDEPRSDEEYGGEKADGGADYSVTHGRDAMYRWTPADGVQVIPFPK